MHGTYIKILLKYLSATNRVKKSSSVTGLEWHRGFQEVKVPIFHDSGTGWW